MQDAVVALEAAPGHEASLLDSLDVEPLGPPANWFVSGAGSGKMGV